METILFPIIWKSCSQGGPAHELGGAIGLIAKSSTVQLLLKMDIIWHSQGLWSIVKSRFTQTLCTGIVLQRKREERNGTGAPEKAVRCGGESENFSFHPPIQRSLFGNPLCFIVPGNCFEVSFQSNISLSGPCSFISKSQSENFPFVWDLITKNESFL